MPTKLLIDLMKHVLEMNVFEYDEELFIQNIGTAMGTESAVSYANLFMKTIDDLITQNALDENNVNNIHLLWRFIDDGFILWRGTQTQLETYITHLNTLHPTIKFTANYNFETKTVIFLDTTVTIKNGTITTDLYRKPTDRIQYLLPSSCHPSKHPLGLNIKD